MRLLLIGAAILVAAVILVVLYSCLVVASRADEAMERNFKADYGEPDEGSNG